MAKMMNLTETQYVKTYKTIANLQKAVEGFDGRYVALQTPDSRYYAMFIGEEMTHVVWHGHAVTN